jgi:hypothetical protein
LPWRERRLLIKLGERRSVKFCRIFDDDCRQLPQLSRCVLRNELAGQIEREALQFSHPDKRAVLTLALKHFNA